MKQNTFFLNDQIAHQKPGLSCKFHRFKHFYAKILLARIGNPSTVHRQDYEKFLNSPLPVPRLHHLDKKDIKLEFFQSIQYSRMIQNRCPQENERCS